MEEANVDVVEATVEVIALAVIMALHLIKTDPNRVDTLANLVAVNAIVVYIRLLAAQTPSVEVKKSHPDVQISI